MYHPAAFLMGIETECLTAVGPRGGDCDAALEAFLGVLARLAPPCAARPVSSTATAAFTSTATATSNWPPPSATSPYALADMVTRQQALAARAVAELKDRFSVELIVANNNHSGRLRDGAATWGAHENYLVGRPPAELADRLLPFLVSRVYGGAGGLWHPTGDFLAGARVSFLQTDVGGGTTERRAVFSTARQEPLLGPRPAGFRCHLILGDGHRSAFNLALHCGATALVLGAVQHDPDTVWPLPRVAGADHRRFWLTAARRFNRLAGPGESPRVAPLALDVQRFYLGRARRFAQTLRPHPWADRLLADWQQTLDRMAAGDNDWLSVRLDAWIKHRLYGQWLREHGRGWHDLVRMPHLFDALVLLDQNYHEFANPANVFDQMDRAGLLAQRVGSGVAPGDEAEPFVPETATRAARGALPPRPRRRPRPGDGLGVRLRPPRKPSPLAGRPLRGRLRSVALCRMRSSPANPSIITGVINRNLSRCSLRAAGGRWRFPRPAGAPGIPRPRGVLLRRPRARHARGSLVRGTRGDGRRLCPFELCRHEHPIAFLAVASGERIVWAGRDGTVWLRCLSSAESDTNPPPLWSHADGVVCLAALEPAWQGVQSCPPITAAVVRGTGPEASLFPSTADLARWLLGSWSLWSKIELSALGAINTAAKKLSDICCTSAPTERPLFQVGLEIDLRHFIPRKEVTVRILAWLQSLDGARVGLLTGPHGAGKTTLAAWLSRRREEAVGVFHCAWGTDRAEPHVCLWFLICRLADRVPEYRAGLLTFLDRDALRSPCPDFVRRMPLETLLEYYFVGPMPRTGRASHASYH